MCDVVSFVPKPKRKSKDLLYGSNTMYRCDPDRSDLFTACNNKSIPLHQYSFKTERQVCVAADGHTNRRTVLVQLICSS